MVDIAIIINSKAKNAQNLDHFLKGFTEHKINYQLYNVNPGNLEQTIKDCCLTHSILLIGGGDGTIRTAAQLCAYTSTLLGVLPLGTMNHFAKELDLPLTVNEVIDALKNKTTTLIDLAEVNGNIFINNSSIGFYPTLVQKRDYYTKRSNKWLSYIPSFIQALFYHKSYSLLVKSNEFNLLLRTSFFMVSNNLYSFEFPLKFTRESFKDAVLGLYYFKHGRLRIIEILRALFTRKHNFDIKQSKYPIEVIAHHKTKITIALDGDTLVVQSPLLYTILPKALTVLKKS